jgi:hypothetical protein
MRLATSSEPADWIPALLHDFAVDVGSFIPDVFESYARILHPPGRLAADESVLNVRWADIAAANGRSVDDEVLHVDISGEPSRVGPSGEELWNQHPRTGSLSREIVERLIQTLGSHTTTPDHCWFGVWNGWGGLRESIRGAPMFSVPGRDVFLLEGSVTDALITLEGINWCFQSAMLWWPDDRAWCVSTEIDFSWTYVGGSQNCIAEVLNDPLLEAQLVTPRTIR